MMLAALDGAGVPDEYVLQPQDGCSGETGSAGARQSMRDHRCVRTRVRESEKCHLDSATKNEY